MQDETGSLVLWPFESDLVDSIGDISQGYDRSYMLVSDKNYLDPGMPGEEELEDIYGLDGVIIDTPISVELEKLDGSIEELHVYARELDEAEEFVRENAGHMDVDTFDLFDSYEIDLVDSYPRVRTESNPVRAFRQLA
ncbi:MAG: hypothetical protein ABEJ66_00820, partial [Candidatus Nanohaloarchaea archaeon]